MHDYDPSWDYPVVDLASLTDLPSGLMVSMLNLIENLQETVALPMGFEEGFEVFYVEPLGLSDVAQDALGVYCSGTSSRPIVGIDLFMIVMCATQEQLSPLRQIGITLVHELAHAYQETLGIEPDDKTEDEAEDFAQQWMQYDNIDLSILKR